MPRKPAKPMLTSLFELKRTLFLTRPSLFRPLQTPLSKSISTAALTLRGYLHRLPFISSSIRIEHSCDDKRTYIHVQAYAEKIYMATEKVALSFKHGFSISRYFLSSNIVVDQNMSCIYMYMQHVHAICLATFAAKDYSLDFPRQDFAESF